MVRTRDLLNGLSLSQVLIKPSTRLIIRCLSKCIQDTVFFGLSCTLDDNSSRYFPKVRKATRSLNRLQIMAANRVEWPYLPVDTLTFYMISLFSLFSYAHLPNQIRQTIRTIEKYLSYCHHWRCCINLDIVVLFEFSILGTVRFCFSSVEIFFLFVLFVLMKLPWQAI